MSDEEIKQDVEDTSQSEEVEIEVEESIPQQEEPAQASSEQSEEEELSNLVESAPVEEICFPELKTKPFVIAPSNDVVLEEVLPFEAIAFAKAICPLPRK